MLFDDWSDVGRVAAMGAAAYASLVIIVRVSGKRTLAKLNAFDLVVTVALGSVLATIALSNDVSLTEGVMAIVVLVVAQWAVSWMSRHTSIMQGLVRSEATVVFRHGTFDESAMTRMRLTHSEVVQAIRSSGSGDLESVAAVVLESDGTLSVISTERCQTGSALPTSSTVTSGVVSSGHPSNRDRNTDPQLSTADQPRKGVHP